jgi:hypothetical protein
MPVLIKIGMESINTLTGSQLTFDSRIIEVRKRREKEKLLQKKQRIVKKQLLFTSAEKYDDEFSYIVIKQFNRLVNASFSAHSWTQNKKTIYSNLTRFLHPLIREKYRNTYVEFARKLFESCNLEYKEKQGKDHLELFPDFELYLSSLTFL